ncbi:MAG: hypothetical protein IPO02_16145 [Bacteroidetes bacterium]|nr:hypothetical protein [Bacteroidota bacterium]
MKLYLYLFATILFSLSIQTSMAQLNFVPNYSFEDNAAFCNGSPGNLWDPAVPNWNSIIVNGSTPDLYRLCRNNNMQTRSNTAGVQTPAHCNSYAGLLGTPFLLSLSERKRIYSSATQRPFNCRHPL